METFPFFARRGMGLSGGISVSPGLAAHLRPYCRFAACAAATSCTKPQTIAAGSIDSSKLIAIGCPPICKKSARSRVPSGSLGISYPREQNSTTDGLNVLASSSVPT
jgi:hypothetical protein